MKRIILVILISNCTYLASNAQSEETKVRAVINTLFTGMKLGDSAMVHSIFHKDVTMATSFRDRENKSALRRESSKDNFLKAVGTPHPDEWNEEIWNVEIKVDADFAQVWCDFAFYVGNKFSHCGIDSFHLHKGSEGWKIFHLADTRRTQGCSIPKEISEKYLSN